MLTMDPAISTNDDRLQEDLPLLSVAAPCALAGALDQPDIDAAIWTRATPASVIDWLSQFPPERWPSGRYVLSPDAVAACLTDMFAGAGMAASPALTWLAEDAERLAHCVRDLAGTAKVRLRFEPVFDNACSKFHIDNVTARLICTYLGPGTELSLAHLPTEAPQRVLTGAPILLKGKLWPGPGELQLHHRSPPIAGTGTVRLVMVLEGCAPDEYYALHDQLYPQSEAEPAK
nr:DUF1826 domain-containing protein [Hyphomonas sp. Mor2]